MPRGLERHTRITLRVLVQSAMRVLRTDRHGDLAVVLRDGRLAVVTRKPL